VLTFIGVKMLLPLAAQGLIMIWGAESTSPAADLLRRYLNHEFEQAVINISLATVAGAILLSIVISLLVPPPEDNAQTSEEE